MSLLYMPLVIPIPQKVVNLAVSENDNRIAYNMDLGTHIRSGGDITSFQLAFEVPFSFEEYKAWKQFFNVAKNRYFYMQYPDQKDPDIIKGKYYLFNFTKIEKFSANRKEIDYLVPIQLNWFYAFPPRDYLEGIE